MVEREGFIILTVAQVRELIAEMESVVSDAFIEGTKVGFADAKDADSAAYDQGYDAGRDDGYADGVNEYGNDYDDGYAEGYENGWNDAEAKAA